MDMHNLVWVNYLHRVKKLSKMILELSSGTSRRRIWVMINQPSRSAAAPEAILVDTTRVAQSESMVVASTLVVASSMKKARMEPQEMPVARRAILSAESPAATPLSKPSTTQLMMLEVPAETPQTQYGSPWVNPISPQSFFREPIPAQDADEALAVDMDTSDPEHGDDDDDESFRPMPYIPPPPHPHPNYSFSPVPYLPPRPHPPAALITTSKTPRGPQTYNGGEPPTISASRYSSFREARTSSSPQLMTKDFDPTLANAEYGDTEAQIRLGDMYLEKKDSRQDETALQWFLKAAHQGDPNGQTRVGIMFMFGRGTQQSYSKAMTWFLKAAKNGHATAQCSIGCLYHEGHGVNQLYSKAMEWNHV
ncbi:hypothetical protein BGZ95_002088 [Linnemannia exigua]|uniref:HCP-like protein n=1 Tax=Linnemannia exigua TaxID=604196 RepID=A0AAD4D850_9FUNG|nr:hypothetical protein BGZ95_002088 [Linnemannia exigua]